MEERLANLQGQLDSTQKQLAFRTAASTSVPSEPAEQKKKEKKVESTEQKKASA